MKLRSRTATWTAVALAAPLVLSACGGSDDGKSTDKIKGAKKDSNSASPSASSDGIKRPEVKLAKDAKNKFENEETGNPKKDAILADNQRRLDSVDQVITRPTKNSVNTLAFYAKDKLLLSEDQYIKDWLDEKKSWTGVTRIYDQSVELDGDDKANVSYCVDESKSKTKLLKSGKLKPNTGGKNNFVYTTVRMERGKNGVWQGVSGDEKAKAKQCIE